MSTCEPTVDTLAVRILHVCSGDVWAGAERMIATLLRELRQDGDKRLIVLVMNEGQLSHILKDSQIETVILPESNHSFASLLWNARRYFGGRAIDIIHSHGYKENVLSGCLARAIGVSRLYSTIHGLPESVQTWSRLRRSKYRMMTRVNYDMLKRRFTTVAAVSHDIRDTLVHQEGFHEDLVRVIHNGIDMAHWISPRYSSARDPRIHIGTVGRMVPVKRFDRFLEVAAEVARQTPHVRFSILGDGPLKDELCLTIKRLELDNTISLNPWQDDPTEYYHSLDLYMNTSDHEGIPLSILEAMACKKPILAPRVGGIPEIITHGEQGYLVERGQQTELARYCMELAGDSQLRRIMGENAYQAVSVRFNSTTMSNEYRQLYKAGSSMNRLDLSFHPHTVVRPVS